MKKYANQVIINGQSFTHVVEASSYAQALEINKQRKITAAYRGRRIIGHLVKID